MATVSIDEEELEASEDMALARAIRQGPDGKPITRDEVFAIPEAAS